jgi:hypothetical protein
LVCGWEEELDTFFRFCGIDRSVGAVVDTEVADVGAVVDTEVADVDAGFTGVRVWADVDASDEFND